MDSNTVVAELQALLDTQATAVPFPIAWHNAEFTALLTSLRGSYVALTRALDGIEPQFKKCNLGDKAAMLILLRTVKHAAEEVKKAVNRTEPRLESDMCIAIAEQGMNQFQTATHTLTAKADAYLSAYPKKGSKDYRAFRRYKAVSVLFSQTISPKALEALCRVLLANGQPLPPGCETFVKASVGIRRKTSSA